VAIEDNLSLQVVLKQRNGSRELVDKYDIPFIFIHNERKSKMNLAQHGAKDSTAAMEVGWDESFASNPDIERAIARFFEAVVIISMGRVNSDLVTPILQAQSSIYNKTLSTANAEVRMHECNLHWG
jgi:hypothetical protein